MQCTLMPPHRDGHCDWCGLRLSGKRRRWCSDGCMKEFRRQHDWDTARDAALVRDGYKCQRCEVLTVGAFEEDWALLPSAPQRPRWEQYDDEGAFQKAIEEWSPRWKVFTIRVVKPLMPEVNHKTPLVGQGYAWGCVHHSDNLETLCHRCHVQVTKWQRSERKLANARKVYEQERARVLELADRAVLKTDAVRLPGSNPGAGTDEQEEESGRRSDQGSGSRDGATSGEGFGQLDVGGETDVGDDTEGIAGAW